jgi:hypothetical protein
MDSHDSLLYVELHKIQIATQLKIMRIVFGVIDDFKPAKAFFTKVFFYSERVIL